MLNDWSLDAFTGGLSHLDPHDLASVSVGVSKWQLKEKMNKHHAHHLPSCLLPFSIPIHTTTYILIFQYPLNPFPSPPSITCFAMHSPTHSFSVLHELEPPCKRLAAHLSVPCSHYPQFISHELITLPNSLPYSSLYLSYQPCPSNLTTFLSLYILISIFQPSH